MKEAMYAVESGDFQRAIDIYRAILDNDPEAIGAWINLGYSLDENGQAGEAVIAYGEALKRVPGNPQLHNNMGVALHSDTQYEAALYHYRKAIELDRNFAWAWWGMGRTLWEMNRLSEARTAYVQAIELGEKSPKLYHDLSRLLLLLGHLELSEDAIQYAIHEEPGESEHLLELAEIRFAQGDYQRATNIWLDLIEQDYLDGVQVTRNADRLISSGHDIGSALLLGRFIRKLNEYDQS